MFAGAPARLALGNALRRGTAGAGLAEDDERLKIDSPEALEAWLKDKPGEWAQVIAVRAALRVFPAVFYVNFAQYRVADDSIDAFRLTSFRVFLLIYLRLIYKMNNDFYYLGEYADRIIKVLISDFDLNPANSSALGNRSLVKGACDAMQAAAYICRDLHSRVYEVSTSVLGSMNSLRGAGGVQPDVVWTAVREDCKYLAKSNSPENLMRQPLWLIDFSGDSRAKFAFERISSAATSFFEQDNKEKRVWRPVSEWYEAVLGDESGSHSYFGEEADRELLGQPNGFWTVSGRRTVEDVLRDIERIRDGKPTVFQAKAASDGNDTVSGPAGDDDLADGEALRTDAVPTHSDEPTTDDQLGRRPFARALVERMIEVKHASGRDGFAIHLHAPWGAGKTSILRMMDAMLQKPEQGGKPWVVVHFNAWEHERRKPPWWPLIQALRTDASACLLSYGTRRRWFRFCRTYALWWAMMNLVPLILAVVALAVVIAVVAWPSFGVPSVAETEVVEQTVVPMIAETIFKLLDLAFKVALSLVAAFGAFLLAGRALVFGSADGAKFFYDLSRDPLKRVKKLFSALVTATGAPVCIFIDDLDRCNTDYVVDLLEGIQTSFRHRNVTYVVAADRAWLRASFEQRYSNFSGHVGNAGQPLGYLFLEKIFQVSTPVPGMGGVKKRYWDGLLTTGGGQNRNAPDMLLGLDAEERTTTRDDEAFDRDVRVRRDEIRREFGADLTEEVVGERLESTTSETERAAIVLELSASRAEAEEVEHLLASFVDILPDNPRVMKRMINTYAMRRAIGHLEGNPVGRDVLARWTILEQRFPALADLLIEHPEWADMLAEGEVKVIDLPQVLQPFAGDKDVVKVLGAPGSEHPLREGDVATITRGSAP